MASVPELTSRTFSTDGTASMISSASSLSASVGAPKLVPRRRGRCDRREHARMAVAQDHRPPGADVVDVAVAVDVEQIGALAALEEDRLAADAAEGPGRAVHAAGHQLLGAGKGGVARARVAIGSRKSAVRRPIVSECWLRSASRRSDAAAATAHCIALSQRAACLAQ